MDLCTSVTVGTTCVTLFTYSAPVQLGKATKSIFEVQHTDTEQILYTHKQTGRSQENGGQREPEVNYGF